MIELLLVVALVVLALLFLVARTVFVSLVSAEARASADHLAQHLVARAARSLPPGLQERYSEEWEAELAVLSDRPLTALAFALRLSVKASDIAAEWAPAPARARNGHSSGGAPEAEVAALEGSLRRARVRLARGYSSGNTPFTGIAMLLLAGLARLVSSNRKVAVLLARWMRAAVRPRTVHERWRLIAICLVLAYVVTALITLLARGGLG
jgi:hypothetical protein